MKKIKCAVAVALTAVCVATCETAHAQYGSTAMGRRPPTEVSNRYGSVALYPFAPFRRGGLFNTGDTGTATDYGGIVTVDLGYQPANSRVAYEVGGWFWKGSGDLYQVHARTFLTQDIAVQLGLLGSSRASGHPYTVFLIYEINSQKVAPEAPIFAIQIAPGLYVNPTGGRTTTEWSVFTQASVEVTRNVTVNVGQWYVRDRATDFNRFSFGIGYSFP